MFTPENTYGFSDDEIDTLNKASEILKKETDLYPKEISNFLNNAWAENCNTVKALVNNVKRGLK